MQIRIPISHHAPLSLLSSIDDREFANLSDIFCNVSGDISTSSLLTALTEQLSTREDAESLLDALVSVALFGQRNGRTKERRVSQVANSDSLELEPHQRELLAARLLTLLATPVLTLLSRAESLKLESNSAYCTSRILTDLRPIFDIEDVSEPAAASIIHTLRIEVHVDSRIESMSIAIDAKGLSEIAEAIERASRKAEALEEVARKSHLRLVSLEAAY